MLTNKIEKDNKTDNYIYCNREIECPINSNHELSTNAQGEPVCVVCKRILRWD